MHVADAHRCAVCGVLQSHMILLHYSLSNVIRESVCKGTVVLNISLSRIPDLLGLSPLL
jgi:hypothetical protein